MIVKVMLLILIFVSLVVESTLVPFPFVLLFSLLYLFYFDNLWGLLLIFVLSIFLDTLSMQQVGITALFIFGSMFAVVTLEKAFSIQGPILFACVMVLCAFFYSSYIGYPFSLILSTVLAVGLVSFILIEGKKQKNGGISA